MSISGAQMIDMGREAVWVLVKASLPIMLAGGLVGLLVSFLQAITQIQEASLVYVPKILVTFLAILFCAPMIGRAIYNFTEEVFSLIGG